MAPAEDRVEDFDDLDGSAGSAEEVAFRTAKALAVKLLGRREHARAELEQKLVRKGHSPAVVGAVVKHLRELDLVSDRRFVEGFARSRLDRGLGPLKIRAELKARGVEEHLVEEMLTETDGFWFSQAQRARGKRFGENPPPDRDHWIRQARYLSQRGYPSDVIYRVLGDIHC